MKYINEIKYFEIVLYKIRMCSKNIKKCYPSIYISILKSISRSVP